VTFTATDACGNTASTTATFRVADTTPPSIGTPASDLTVQCDGSGNTSDLNAWLAARGGATATDTCGNVSWGNNYTGLSDDCGATGSALVTFTATDECGNSATTTATFTIEDTTAPLISTPATSSLVECDGAGNTDTVSNWLAAHGGAEASDVCSGVTWSFDTTYSQGCGAAAFIHAVFTATDECNNSSTTSATFQIADRTSPEITQAASDITIECGPNAATEINNWLNSNGGASATDDCSGLTWSHDFAGFTGCSGNQLVTFTAEDACHKETTTTATITLIDTTEPTIDTAASDLTLECGPGNSTALGAWLDANGGASASDNC
jgi:hypothetical protein